ncbi:uncharacterized protein LOC143216486 isoform X2 [Lasioglossum baleicum]|uniref:uncharacterized protein LOC143216486 isoform X2 n=1 Tax=Lasioglossum baleicum TaxID=434251 RepID=UPI003FCCDA6C
MGSDKILRKSSLRNELECEEVVQPKSKDDKVKKKTKDRSLKNETCQKKQVDTKKEDHECLDSYVNEEKCQEDYSRKKKRKMKQAR